MKIYLIPGLGADRRMYYQQFKVFPQAQVLEHFVPADGVTMPEYAKQMAKCIDTSEPFALIGTSLGGIISVELSRILNPEKIILISSVKSRDEMPAFIRSMKYLRLHRILSGEGYKRFNKLAAKRLDSRGDSQDAALIMEMMNDIPSAFIDWAINAVVHWSPPQEYRTDIIHIHGTNDLLFPFSRLKNAIAVANGSHIMNMTKGEEVNRLLLEAINAK
ncbi:MAG TPA: alpha/beta hydrolase [Chitinophagales bacterium]|nr:alpha/beta hydrolase [Chitinophagales bacterium]